MWNVGLALVSGVGLFLAFPPANASALAWVALVPLFWALHEKSGHRRFWLGFAAGLGFFALLLYWIVVTLQAAQVSWIVGFLALFLLSGYLAIYFGLFALCSNFPSAAAAAFVVLEWARGHFLGGFPWGVLGYSQWKIPAAIQIAEWTGVYGVSFAIVFVNAELARSLRRRRFSPVLVGFLALYAGVNFWLSGQARAEIASAPAAEFAVLQGNVSQYEKWSDAMVEKNLRVYAELAAQVSRAQNPLVLWPETALPGWFPNNQALARWTQNVVRQSQLFHVVGAVTSEAGENFNSAFLLASEGRVVQRYDKMHLVPFGEFVPCQNILGRFIAVLNELGGFSGGREIKLLPAPQAPLGMTICFEGVFAEICRREVLSGAEILANVTNDGWYLDTAAPEQHFAFYVLRAVENRRSVVRAANTGISGFILPTGEIQKKSELNTRGVLEASAPKLTRVTFYSRWGDIFCFICLVVLLIGAFHGIRQRTGV